MKFRRMENIDIDVSVLGFGCMRLPVIKGDAARIDKDEAKKMLYYSLDHGVNYVDTAFPYHQGESEGFVGEALQGGMREEVFLATKMPTWLVKTAEDFEKYLDEQLKKLKTEQIDFYLLHGLNQERWQNVQQLDVFSFLEKAVKKGKIRFPSFSFHDEVGVFKEIIDAYPWCMSQIQLNYMDEEYQAGLEGLKYAEDKGIPVVVMEPLRGGKLAQRVPDEIVKVWEKNSTDMTPAEWAFKWVYSYANVKSVLSGMSTMEQVKENVEIFKRSKPNALTSNEKEIIEEVKAIYRSRMASDCTRCGYCLPCPSGVKIPEVLEAYNNATMYNIPKDQSIEYKFLMEQGASALECTECGQCESVCPQDINIREAVKEAHNRLVS